MKRPRLSKSGIEYLDYAWNFASGCLNGQNGVCPVGENCWAKKITERFKSHYPNAFRPTFYPEAFLSPLSLKKPSRIGVCFMGDLFGDWIDPEKKVEALMPSGKASIAMSLKGWIFTTIEQCPQHTFVFLTKCPWNLQKWTPFPNNCQVGITAMNDKQYMAGLKGLGEIGSKVIFISFEPLLEEVINNNRDHGFCNLLSYYHIGWVIIGAMTCGGGEISKLASQYPQLTAMPSGDRYTLQPRTEWVEQIVEATDKAGARVFLKENLRPLLYQECDGHYGLPSWAANSSGNLRQELSL